MSRLPQHLTNLAQTDQMWEAVTRMPPSLSAGSRRCASPGVMSVALPCLLLTTAPASQALSPSTVASNNVRSLVDQARMIREIKSGNEPPHWGVTKDSFARPHLDNDALSAALFDGDFNNSLESAVANLNLNGVKVNSAKRRAEQFDRFMEEDATVASIVLENVKPGSLVDAVQHCKGADVVDMETFLQREAADRRRSRAQARTVVTKDNGSHVASAVPPKHSFQVIRKTKLASTPQSSSEKRTVKHLTKYPLLTKEQEYALANTIQAGAQVHKLKAEYESSNSQPLSKRDWAQLANMSPNDLRRLVSDYRTAKQELVSSNMGLVHVVVKKYAGRAKYRGLEMDELIQEGTLGLIRAAELFDPAKGLRFSTYATIWIKGVLSGTNLLEDVIKVPDRERVLRNKVQAAMDEMKLESGEGISIGKLSATSSSKELAARLGMKRTKVETHLRRMACVSKVLSLDYQYSSTTRSGDANDKNDMLMNSAQFGTDADLAERAQFKADVVAGLVRNLSEKEVTLMRLRYGLEDGNEYTIKECASMMGINRETARLLQHKCLKKLREASDMESLQEYLMTVA
mmetsp:Transcript_43914/g.93437  ORF Transcript_43914/g.93437 Transcript_43914/m.93437 type:complete len:574 (+) Transcript_43914:100-1821(+)|eukprot:CAMPEP_0172557954 /NCGR_PEP_ID=MMETSP1067-20121228/76330_1 /TAXON_ID=265564 ORGANISM="Thalassiosira punctigera, Strain Tpunct2005C2" /NCGR_SAMPLE_ID=MMETSP1067 /ASSEMBLY_ACC=CAM_ASM_000444 /LENGTH=573 /DNA_ID=CAMNT_0013347181 /DNA_START=83 /DNA_END=1804 /DNA_ORIENTATION=+